MKTRNQFTNRLETCGAEARAHIEQLLASFPGFIDTIEQTLEGFDVHIMTANPDAYWPGWTCEKGGCMNPDNSLVLVRT